MRPVPAALRLLQKTKLNVATGCVEWTEKLDSGYGKLRVKGKGVRAHRFAWEQANGAIPSGADVRHNCGNLKCVALAHLFLGTRADVKVTPLKDRLFRKLKVNPATACLEWMGSRFGEGYGHINVKGRGLQATHRIAWEISNGPVPDGLFVLHECDNPPCCNVQHLFLGTHLDNMADMRNKGRRIGR